MAAKKKTSVKKKAATSKPAVSKTATNPESITKTTKQPNVTELTKRSSLSSRQVPGGRRSSGTQQSPAKSSFSGKSRQDMIQLVAYLNAEKRGFTNGDPLQDWLLAEEQVDKMLSEDAA